MHLLLRAMAFDVYALTKAQIGAGVTGQNAAGPARGVPFGEGSHTLGNKEGSKRVEEEELPQEAGQTRRRENRGPLRTQDTQRYRPLGKDGGMRVIP